MSNCMNESVAKLTFVLTLKGRANYTESWIQNNVKLGYKFYVADGSPDDENRNIFKKIYSANVTYKHCGEDVTIKDYLTKIFESIAQADTEYVMLCDNDDFINYKGVEECVTVLDENDGFTCAGGSIFSIFENKKVSNLYNLPIPFLSTKSIHKINIPFEAFKEIRKEYTYVYYAVYRKEALLQIWKKIIEMDLQDLFLVEMLQVDLALHYGTYYHIKKNHYIRLMNSGFSGASSHGAAYHKRIFFDTVYREQLFRLNRFYAELYGREIAEIEEQQANFYLWFFKQAPRIKSALLRKIHGAIIRLPFFHIQNCISILNVYLKIKISFKAFFK